MQSLTTTTPSAPSTIRHIAANPQPAGSPRPGGATAPARRPIRPRSRYLAAPAAAVCALLLSTLAASAQFTISDGTGVFAPSFRDGANTTWFGWSSGTFDGTPDNELLDNPAVTLGLGGLDGTLNQVGTSDIMSSSNSIYTGAFTPITLSLEIPTSGTVGIGFTTIIVQGRTAFGSYPEGSLVFPELAGATPDFVIGFNSAGQGQFWAKYEIAGNEALYDLDFNAVGGAVSIATLTVDTQWSSSEFAPDTAQAVPEPSTAISLIGGVGLLMLVRRRRAALA